MVGFSDVAVPLEVDQSGIFCEGAEVSPIQKLPALNQSVPLRSTGQPAARKASANICLDSGKYSTEGCDGRLDRSWADAIQFALR